MEFPVKAKYSYLQYNHDKGFIPISVDCEVISEAQKTYLIKLLTSNVRCHKYGDEIRVHKDSVNLPKEPRDCSNDYWQDL